MAKSRRSRRARIDPVAKLARTILPPEQVSNLVICDVANHSDADQRDMESLKRTKTVRKLTRVELMLKAGVINAEQAQACAWYVESHELGYQTVGCTANYTGAGGGGFGPKDLLGRYSAQIEARANYRYARLALPAHLVERFDSILFDPDIRPPQMMAKADKASFSLCAFLLHGQIGHLLAIAA
jgi:hypothetical protein